MALSNGIRIKSIAAANSINITSAELFIASISANTAYTLTNLTDTKVFRVVITNTSGADVTISFAAAGWTAANAADLMTRVRAGRTQVYEILLDTSTLKYTYLSPLRLEAIYAP